MTSDPRELSSDGGFELGELSRREDRLIVGTEAEKLTDLWGDLRFWSIAAAARLFRRRPG